MPLKLVWAADSRRDLREIVDYIAARNPSAAEKLQSRIKACAERAAQLPRAFRIGRVEGTREAVAHPNYIVVYQIQPDRVRILRVLHARRRYP